MSIHTRIAIAHVIGTTGTSITIRTVCHLIILQFIASNLSSRITIYDRYIEWTIALRLCTIVHDSITIYVRHITTHGIFTPCLVLLIPKASAITGANHHFCLTVTIDIVSNHHIILST